MEARDRRRRLRRQHRLPARQRRARASPIRRTTRTSSPSARRTPTARSRPKDDAVGVVLGELAAAAAAGTPDFVAPGSHLQGLRVVNSWLDANHPEGRLDDRYFRGSGTSQATAITSGAVALVLQRYPTLTPDVVKRFFADNAHKLAGSGKQRAGRGRDRPRRDARHAAATDATPELRRLDRQRLARARPRHRTTSRATASSSPASSDIFGKPVDTAALAQRRGRAAAPGRAATGTAAPGRAARGRAAPGRGALVGAAAGRAAWSGAPGRELVVGQLLVGQLAGPAAAGPGSSWSDASWG